MPNQIHPSKCDVRLVLPRDLRERAERVAAALHLSRTEVIVQALDKYLSEVELKAKAGA